MNIPYRPLKQPPPPRNGHTYVIGIVARISGCQNQKDVSLDDQVDHAKEYIAGEYPGPFEFRVISTTGKGEWLDRPELAEIEAMLRSRELDALVMNDIGRMIRGAEAVRLCGIAVDHGTRVLSPNDCIDTLDDTWEPEVIAASRDHVSHNAQTSKRLKQKLMNRFVKFGGCPARPIYGYIIPEGAKTYGHWLKDPAAAPFIREGWRILKETGNCSAVAEFFNSREVPVGPHCRRGSWDGKMVRRFYRSTILKGCPGRGFRKTVKHNESGHRISVKNPDGPVFFECPHLAHLDPAEFDELAARLKTANGDMGRKPVNGQDPLLRRPKKRTRFPGQHAQCWYCGRRLVWGANGAADGLMCPGARERRCWNSIAVAGGPAAGRLVEFLTAELFRLEGLDAQFAAMVAAVGTDRSGGLEERRRAHLRNVESLKREKENLIKAVAQCGPGPLLSETLAGLESRDKELARVGRQLEREAGKPLQLPASVAELRRLFEAEFRSLTVGSPAFGDLMRKLVPDFHVHLVRLCDGGHLLPRARCTVNWEGIAPDLKFVPGAGELLQRTVALELFEPPQRERIRAEAVRLAAAGDGPGAIAAAIAEKPTLTAVQNALALERRMRELGREDPYVLVTEPPDDYPKLRRHRNPKYRFEPLDGYRRPDV